jgi:hypothetical protein
VHYFVIFVPWWLHSFFSSAASRDSFTLRLPAGGKHEGIKHKNQTNAPTAGSKMPEVVI